MTLPPHFILHPEVKAALKARRPVVALESAVITHGLPRPENLLLAQQLEQEVREQAAVPATIALLGGNVHIGLSTEELDYLASGKDPARKISVRDFGVAIARRENGGTTVAATLVAAHRAGVQVFATGGIGGVHRDAPFDMSADLPELGRTPLVVVCAGAKAILDLPATLETLETMGVAVIGYQTDEFPAFYSASSGLKLTIQAQTPGEVAEIARAQWQIGITSAVLVVQPPPAEAALPHEQVDRIINQAVREAAEKGIRGSAVTPFLLGRVSELSGGASLRTNLALLRNNARLAAQIAAQLGESPRIRTF
jgi:pseudouridine-5'-phosphate glycosidase